MNKSEVTKLLAVAGAFDRFLRVDDMTVIGWGELMRDVPYGLAYEAVKAHYAGPDASRPLMPAHIIKAVEVAARLTRGQVEADVRTAKAYGLIEGTWPDRQVLPERVRVRLAEVREGVRREALGAGVDERISSEEFGDMERREGGTAA